VIGTGTHAESSGSFDEYFQADFTNVDQISSCADYVRSSKPDVLINNAGINKNLSFVEIDPIMFQRIQQVNVFAPFSLCQAAIPSMQRKGWGRIVNISSIWGKIGKEHRAAYSASKFALDGLTLSLAAEHAADGILANCVAPGFTDTELTQKMLGEEGIRKILTTVPIRRMANVEEIARFVVWLSSPENSYITGQNIAIDGGFSRV
jgi:NAD(P)-dependent dehydrogenase (short-subunit alcohol dehydrogenase family)